VSQPDSRPVSGSRGLYGEKPRANMYTALLTVALLALLVGCLFLILEVKYQKGDQKFFDKNVRQVQSLRLAQQPEYV